MNQFERFELLLGTEALEKLNNSRVAVFGVGGVGGTGGVKRGCAGCDVGVTGGVNVGCLVCTGCAGWGR